MNIDRIETNLQIAHAPKSAVRDFRTDYLLKVFRLRSRAHACSRKRRWRTRSTATRILADDGLKREFKAWLLDPVNLVAFDRGTVLIPEKFLAKGAIAPTPVGFDRIGAAAGVRAGAGRGAAPVFSEADVVAALKKRREGGVKLQNIRSPRGLRAAAQRRHLCRLPPDPRHRRLPFPRRRLDGGEAVNSTIMPASPHFFGDQVRRRDILARVARRHGRRITRADLPAGRNCAAAASSPAPNITTAGARIAMCRVKPAAGNDARFPRLDLRRGPDLSRPPARSRGNRHVLCQKP